MKVLFILIQDFNPTKGGVERSTYKIASFLCDNGYDCEVFSFSNQPSWKSDKSNLTILNASKPGSFENPNNLQQLSTLIRTSSYCCILNQSPYYVNKQIVDAVQASQTPMVGCLRQSLFMFRNNIELNLKKNLPSFVHFLLSSKLLQQLILIRHDYRQNKVMKRILDTHAYYVMLTESNVREIQYFVGNYKNEKVIQIPNSIPKVHAISASEKENILLHVGRINTTQKRSDLLLPIWGIVKDKIPSWRFVIVGDGPYLKEMKRIVEERKIERVSFVGFADPNPYYRKAKIFVMPSAWEGFPNTLIEAQSYGCVPVVYDSYDAVRDIVADGENALLVPPFNVEAMANAILVCAQDETRMVELSEASLNNVDQYTIAKVGKRWDELIRSFPQNQTDR